MSRLSSLPARPRDPAVIVHDIPGRLRLISRRLRRSEAADDLRAALRALPGVRETVHAPRASSLAIHHDGSAGTREAILLRLAAAGLELRDGTTRAMQGAPDVVTRLATILAEHLAEHLIKRAAFALVGALV